MAYFKYKNVADILRQKILTGEYTIGQQIPTEMTLCEEFSVSRRTIRTALASLEEEGFLNIQQGSGAYVSEWGQREKSDNISATKNIAVILTDIDTYIYPAVLKGINNELLKSEHGLTLRITENSIFREARVIESLLSTNIDAVILDPAKAALTDVNHHLYQKIAQKIPCVTIHARIPNLNIPAITMSDAICFGEMTRHVLSKGHSKLAGIFYYDEMSGTERFKGFVQTLRATNIELEENNVLWLNRTQLSEQYLESLLDLFLDKNTDRTAFLCVNDKVASMLIYCLKKRGKKVPKDVSVTGFDDAPLMATNLTTMSHPQETMGVKAAQAVLELLKNPNADVNYEFSPLLIDRESVRTTKD